MKINEVMLNVSIDDLKSTIDELSNGNDKFLSILDNLFLIKNINTCLHVKKTNSWFNHKNESFKISYNDENIRSVFNIRFNYEDDSCFAFLKQTDFINEEQLNSINAEINKKLRQIKTASIEEAVESANMMLYNEALILMTSTINKNDVEAVKTDFETKYNKWKLDINEINKSGSNLLNALYKMILKIKLNERL